MPGPIGSMLKSTEQTTAAPVSIDQLERTGRRLSLLQRHAPELVSSSVSGALALAESNMSEAQMVGSATDAIGYANVQRLYSDLQDESPEAARGIWASTPEALQRALREMGYEPPPPPERRKSNRWGINLPDFLPIDELTISRDTPILGPLGNVQAGLGEVLEEGRDLGGKALAPFAWLGEQSTAPGSSSRKRPPAAPASPTTSRPRTSRRRGTPPTRATATSDPNTGPAPRRPSAATSSPTASPTTRR
jgi:hypothetical protein